MFRNKPLIITVIVIIVLVILLVVSSTSATVAKSAGVAGGVFSPVQEFFYGISTSIDGFFDGLVNKDDQEQKNQELQSELEVFKSKSRENEELKKENERLTALLEYKQATPEQGLVLAKVTGKNPGNWFDVFTINLGRKDGIRENMPVITADGLVGRIEEVGLNFSKVMAVIDARSSVNAIMERTRDHVAVKGAIASDSLDVALNITYLPIYSDVQEGDKIITAGTDDIYPKGFLIGEVAASETTEADGKNVKVKPAVDFRRLEEVFVVVSVDGAETGTISAANEVIVGDTTQPEPSSAPSAP